MNLVSVIIPYFKKKDFIKESVNSARKQTYKNLEIIIIYDDTSKADLNYIKNLKKIDRRIKLIINPKTIGVGASRNVGIRNSKGKYIAFLDADDVWKLNKIKYQINFMQRNNYKCSHTSYSIINRKNKTIGYRKAKIIKSYKQLLKSCDIGLSTVMIENVVFSNKCKFPNIKTKEDFVLWLKILKNKNIFGAINKKLTSWRSLNNSLSSSIFQKLVDGFRVYYVYMNFNFIKSLYLLFCLSFNYLKR